MTVISLYFFIFLLFGVMIYYAVPKKGQWSVLLLLSIVFYYLSAKEFYTIVLVFITAWIAYTAGSLLQNDKIRHSSQGEKQITLIAVAAVVLNILIWFLLKGSSFWISASKALNNFIPSMPVLSALPVAGALGMGYYTAQAIGYIMDCYWGNIKPQGNFFKLLLFLSFFPQLTVGPISRYSQLESLYEKHAFSYQNLCFGCQRIVWGMFKKLVISDRTGIIINGIWADSAIYTGFWPWIAVLLYPLQIYTDFSGCMDIVLGAAELFDIHLAENFRNPFFSRSVQEFWQRWHITLGAWARDYVYYPVLKSRLIQRIGKWSKKHFSKRVAKFIPWAIGMGVLWLVMGIWHGTVLYVFGVSMWYWLILIAGELFQPISKRLTQMLHINTECFSWHLVQSIRTYILYAIGVLFFSSDSLRDALDRCRLLFRSFKSLNPWIFFDGSVTGLGVAHEDINLLIVGVFLLFIVAGLREKYGFARNWVQEQILPFRWFVWLFLFVIVLVCGLYGPGYDASAFIYAAF